MALAVGFGETTEFVFGDDADKLGKLNRLVRKGGEPVGFVGVAQGRGRCTVATRPLAEYDGADWVKDYLRSLAASFGLVAEEKGLGRVARGEN